MRQVVIAGATGLVGRELVRQLAERRDVETTALVRRQGALKGFASRVREVVFDYRSSTELERLGAELPCDLLFCALGTTLKRAGSPEAFREALADWRRAIREVYLQVFQPG